MLSELKNEFSSEFKNCIIWTSQGDFKVSVTVTLTQFSKLLKLSKMLFAESGPCPYPKTQNDCGLKISLGGKMSIMWTELKMV